MGSTDPLSIVEGGGVFIFFFTYRFATQQRDERDIAVDRQRPKDTPFYSYSEGQKCRAMICIIYCTA